MTLREHLERLSFIFFVLILLAMAVGPVFAQEAGGVVVTVPPTEVVLNWGDFLAIFLANIADPTSVAWTAFGIAMTWLVAQLPGPAKWAFNVFKVDQLLAKALIGAINSTKGAVAGKSLDVNVGSEVLAKAIQYAVDNGQKWLIDWMGGANGVEEKLIARMSLDATVDGAELVQSARAIGPVRITEPAPDIVAVKRATPTSK